MPNEAAGKGMVGTAPATEGASTICITHERKNGFNNAIHAYYLEPRWGTVLNGPPTRFKGYRPKARLHLRALREAHRPHVESPSCPSKNTDRRATYIGVHLRQHAATQQIILKRIPYTHHIYIHLTSDSRHSQTLVRSIFSLNRRIKKLPAECHVLHFRVIQKTRRHSEAVVFADGFTAPTLR